MLNKQNGSQFKKIIYGVVLFVIGFAAGRVSLGKVSIVDFEKSARKHGLWNDNSDLGWPRTNGNLLIQYAKINGLDLMAPIMPEGNVLLVMDSKNKNHVQIDKYRVISSFNVGRDNTSDVVVWDKDRKRIFDAVMYDIYDNNGKPIGNVIDSDRDGQPEIKTYYDHVWGKGYKIKSIYYFIDDKWHLQEKRNGVNGTIVNGAWKELIKKGRTFHFKD